MKRLLPILLVPLLLGVLTARAQLWQAQVVGTPGAGGAPLSIAFVKDADLGSFTAATFTTGFTVNNNSVNELLVVLITGDNSTGVDDCSGSPNGVTYAGTTLTLAGKYGVPNGLRYAYIFYLMHPAVGANNVIATCATSHALRGIAAEYSGVAATSPIDGAPVTNAQPNGPATMTTSITTTVANDWIIAHSGANGFATAGTNAVCRLNVTPSHNPNLCDSGAALTPAGAFNFGLVTITVNCNAPCQQGVIMVAVKPGP